MTGYMTKALPDRVVLLCNVCLDECQMCRTSNRAFMNASCALKQKKTRTDSLRTHGGLLGMARNDLGPPGHTHGENVIPWGPMATERAQSVQ